MATEVAAVTNGLNKMEMNDHQENGNNNNSHSSGILATEVLNVQNKRYYFDVKEHEYGRFLKLAETAQSGRKSRLVIPMYLVPEVEQVLIDFDEELKRMPEFQEKQRVKHQENGGGDGAHVMVEKSDSDEGGKRNNRNRRSKRGGKGRHESTEAAIDIKDSLVEKGRRKYYFNLKENTRGRYLRLKAIGDIPSTTRRRGFNTRNGRNGKNGGRNSSGGNDVPRAIILPAQGLSEFRDIVSKLLKEFKVDAENDQVALADKNIELNGTANDKLPASQRFSSRSFRKVIFLDAGENSRGFFARMTELQSSYRESVTVPSRHFKEIGEWFLEAARVTVDDDRENNRPEKNSMENGSGDAKMNGNGNHAEYDDDDSSDLDVVAGNRRRQAASDSEE